MKKSLLLIILNLIAMEPMFKYIRDQRLESRVFIGLGIFATILATTLLIFTSNRFLFGLCLVLYLSSAVQILAGVKALKRLPQDLERLTRYIDFEVHRLSMEEIPRVESLVSELVRWKWLEILLILGGLAMIIFKIQNDPEVQGMSLGFVLQASIMLGLGHLTIRRTRRFLNYLKSQAPF